MKKQPNWILVLLFVELAFLYENGDGVEKNYEKHLN